MSTGTRPFLCKPYEVDSLRGKLLIAAPQLFDFFRRTVVLVIEHNEEGAFGVVLNRGSETPVEAGTSFAAIADPGRYVYIGGPVAPSSVVVLGEFEDIVASPKPIVGDLGVVDLDDGGAAVGRARIYAGHAGWAPGQLEDELETNAWLIEDAEPEHVFYEGDLWADLLRERGGQWELIATMPEDPTLN